jgi:hypothetical protein
MSFQLRDFGVSARRADGRCHGQFEKMARRWESAADLPDMSKRFLESHGQAGDPLATLHGVVSIFWSRAS